MRTIGAVGLHVEPMSPAVGAYVTGVDRPSVALRDLFLEHHVLVLRGLDHVSAPGLLEFAAEWGEPYVHPYVDSVEGAVGVMEIGPAHEVTTTWHSDSTHSPRPPAITMLLARVIPPGGRGDTCFANQHLAYDHLSVGMRRMLDGLRAVHSATELATASGVERNESIHPVVRTHPDTGRKALFVNLDYVDRFEGMTPAESRPLLAQLCEHAGSYELTARHRWQVGDLLMWDNRSVQHRVVPDFEGMPRLLHRATVIGEEPE